MTEQITNYTQSLWTGLTTAFSGLMSFVPALFGAMIVLFFGWLIAKFVGKIVERVLMMLKIETVVEKAHLSDYLPRNEKGVSLRLSTFIGALTKWFIFLIFVQAAAITIGIDQLSSLFNSIILFIPNIVVATIILVVGAWAARVVSSIVETSTSSMGNSSRMLPLIARYGILGFAMIAAVSQLGIATNLINILFTGLVAFLALSFGLAFGLGGQGVASDITRSWLENGRASSESRGRDDSVREDIVGH